MKGIALRYAVTALAVALCLSAPATLPAAAAEGARPDTATGRTVIADGHVDIGPRFAEDGWTVQIRDDTVDPAVWRDTDDVVLQVKDTARIKVPDTEEFGFLGKPGDDVWVLPQAQQQGVVWPGWNSQDPQVAATVAREVTWELTDVTGPGHFVLFLNGAFGTPEVVFDTVERLPQETGIEVNSHVHGNWAFTEPGTYLVGVRMTATTKDGKTHDSRRTLRFSVGPQNPDSALTAQASASPDDAEKPQGTSGSPAETRSDDGSSSTPLWLGIGAAAVVAAVLVIVVLRRGRGDTAGREPSAEPGTASAEPTEPGKERGENDESA
ncbi:TIGR03773 family transporter-associated surface protein [Streptomyces sp. MMCC 100]|uniref:TIGR03773 family transporter-associated surface protein n=1 Tax=Streptomyces sp. MMCC 100 TaxID=3163555 RepID=UPI00359B33C0